MASDCDEEIIQSISSWAWHNGIIFQITDDILDLNSDSDTLGKAIKNISNDKISDILHNLNEYLLQRSN